VPESRCLIASRFGLVSCRTLGETSMSNSDRSLGQTRGGLTEIALDPSEEYILVVSPSGRGLYELSTGERLARDRAQPRHDSDWRQSLQSLSFTSSQSPPPAVWVEDSAD
jgi:hypothetical protein